MKKIFWGRTSFVHILVYLSFLCIVICAIYGWLFSPSANPFKVHAETYNEQWVFEKSDGTKETFYAPTKLNVKEGEPVRISTILPYGLKEGSYLCVLSDRSFTVYLQDVEIYRFDCNDRQFPGEVVKSIYVPIEIRTSYAGKKLTIVRDEANTYNGNINVFYLGSRLGLMRTIAGARGIQFVGACLLVLMSITVHGVFSFISSRNKRRMPLTSLSVGIFAISVWIICDSFLFQFVFSKYYVDGIIAYMVAIVLAAPFFMYLDSIQNYRYRKIYQILEGIACVNFVVLSTLHFLNIVNYEKSLPYISFCLGTDAVFIIVLMIKDFFLLKHREHSLVMIGLLGMTVMAIFELLLIFVKATTNANLEMDGVFIMLGLYFLFIFAVLDQVMILVRMQKATSAALAATKAKSDFLANMSHEIRTPINAILGMNEMILRESNQEEIREYARDSQGAGETLLEIVNDILDFSKIESGKMEIVVDRYNLGEMIFDVTSLVTIKAETKGLHLITTVDPMLPTTLLGDDKRVKEIITNILNNAVKYTDQGQIDLKVSGTKTMNETLELVFEVTDTGKGIKEEDIDKIFSGFERVDLISNKNVEGTGLGLSITKRLIELMDGSVSVSSEYGSGSTFLIKLPQVIVDDTPLGDYLNHRHASMVDSSILGENYEAPDATILVVDDLPLNLKVITRLLKKTAINVVCAESGKAALKLMEEQKFDLIMLDHMMPEMDGIETLVASRMLAHNLNADTPIIVLTANAIVGAKETYLQAGFFDYLSKPIVPRQLDSMMISYLPKEKVHFK